MIYDGEGGEPYKADLGIKNDTIAFIGDLSAAMLQMKLMQKEMLLRQVLSICSVGPPSH